MTTRALVWFKRDLRFALKPAKDRFHALRATPEARAEADAVQAKHGSRRSGLPPQRSPRGKAVAPSPQLDLFS